VVRHRFPFDDSVKFYLEGTEEGSFNWRLAAMVGPLAFGLATNGIYDLAKLALGKAIGEEPTAISTEVQNINETKSGDIDALVEAIEPALKKAHYGIGETAHDIIIEETHSKRVIVHFDATSKSYLNDNIDADTDTQDVSVSALNVNDRTGRVYFLDLKRTIPFRISNNADPKTISVLSAAIDRYANKISAPVRLTFSVSKLDGRLKRVVADDADEL
jgi:hypothetical protein